MTARGVAALFLGVLAAGCGGSSAPDGTPFSVRIEVVEPAPYGPQASAPQPLMVDRTYAAWARLSRLLPDPLPEPIDQGEDCFSGQVLSVRVTKDDSHLGEVSYGPCRWPEEIEPVRLFMRTLLQRRLAAERRCDCP